ncbi:MAG: uracil-DNA glycosylase [Thermodesulfobacteriota bacterium]
MISQKSLLQDFREIVLDLREYLNYQKDIGIEGFPTFPERTDSAGKHRVLSSHDSGIGICEDLSASACGRQAGNLMILEAIREELVGCKRCKLHSGRRNIVFGTGNESAKLLFVGEGPGQDEDIRGEPFVGKAGQLLTRIINAINLNRKEVYIANIIKCRPPGNRNPEPDEIKACEPFLTKQIQAIKPEIICALGTFAAQTLLKTNEKISKLRGRFHSYSGIKLIPTYHPAFLLRNPNFKRFVWEDMQMIQKEYLSRGFKGSRGQGFE